MNFMAGMHNMLNDLSEINALAGSDPRTLFSVADLRYAGAVAEIAQNIQEGIHERHIVMFSGPSASGKTTSAHMLAATLIERGVGVKIVSLDNFYLSGEDVPCLEDGSKDLESVHALDIPKIQQCLSDILVKRECDFPIYDFQTSRRSEESLHIELGESDVIIFEGIHALDPVITENLPADKLLNLFISLQTPYMDGEKEILSAHDVRLCRRMLRDYWFRASSPEYTLKLWIQVLRGEKLYIEPNRCQAQFELNSFHSFEPCLYRGLVTPLMEMVPEDSLYYKDMQRMINELSRFEQLPLSLLSGSSMVREFTGR